MKEELYKQQNSELSNPPESNTYMKESNIHTKLLQFQKMNITIARDGSNPHFKSRYSTLNEVLDKVKKPLNDLGIVIMQLSETEGLRTTLLDVQNGTEVTSIIPYVGNDTAQKTGACITYYRRYGLVSLLGLEDDDDDGTVASTPITKANPKSPIDMDTAPDFNI